MCYTSNTNDNDNDNNNNANNHNNNNIVIGSARGAPSPPCGTWAPIRSDRITI